MTSEYTAKAWLCPDLRDAISVSEFSSDCDAGVPLKENEGLVTARLAATADAGNVAHVNAKIVPEGVIAKLCKGQLSGSLVYYMVLLNEWIEDLLGPGFVLKFNSPEDCDWLMTQLIGHHYGEISHTVPGSGGGDCPETKADAFSGGGLSTVITDSLVPGETVAMAWWFSGDPVPVSAAHTFVFTCCLTGGYVTAVEAEYGTTYITYEVRAEGVLYTDVAPTDFYEYQVGDWVYLIKPGGGCAETGRPETCQGIELDAETEIVIAPFQINGIGPTVM